MKFYKRDPDRALAGMSGLSLEQRGAYNSIIDLLYSCDGLVRDNDRAIAKTISVDLRQWRRVKAQLLACGKIRIDNDGLLQANGVQERLDQAQLRSELARRSATHRWDLFRLSKKFNDTPMRKLNASKSKSKNSELPLPKEHAAPQNVDNGDNDESFGVVTTSKSVATGALEAVVRAKGWSK